MLATECAKHVPHLKKMYEEETGLNVLVPQVYSKH